MKMHLFCMVHAYGGQCQTLERGGEMGTRKERVMVPDRFQISFSFLNKTQHHHQSPPFPALIRRRRQLCKQALLDITYPFSIIIIIASSPLRTGIGFRPLFSVWFFRRPARSGALVILFVMQLFGWSFGLIWRVMHFLLWTSAGLSLFQLNFSGLWLDWTSPSLISQRSKIFFFEFALFRWFWIFFRFFEAEVGSIELIGLFEFDGCCIFFTWHLPSRARFSWIWLITTWFNEP